MYSQTLLTTSPRGRGSAPTTAASSFDGCKSFCSALGFWSPALAGSALLPFSFGALAALAALGALVSLDALVSFGALVSLGALVGMLVLRVAGSAVSADHDPPITSNA